MNKDTISLHRIYNSVSCEKEKDPLYPVEKYLYCFLGSFGNDEYSEPSIGKALMIPS